MNYKNTLESRVARLERILSRNGRLFENNSSDNSDIMYSETLRYSATLNPRRIENAISQRIGLQYAVSVDSMSNDIVYILITNKMIEDSPTANYRVSRNDKGKYSFTVGGLDDSGDEVPLISESDGKANSTNDIANIVAFEIRELEDIDWFEG